MVDVFHWKTELDEGVSLNISVEVQAICMKP
jgi:hypothetical protein